MDIISCCYVEQKVWLLCPVVMSSRKCGYYILLLCRAEGMAVISHCYVEQKVWLLSPIVMLSRRYGYCFLLLC